MAGRDATLEALAERLAVLENEVARLKENQDALAAAPPPPSTAASGLPPVGGAPLGISDKGRLAAHMTDIVDWAFRYLAEKDEPIDKSANRLFLSLVVTPFQGGEAQVQSLGELLGEDAGGIAALAAAAGHPVRVRLLKLLAEGDKSSHDLAAAVDLNGGPLYHHLRELTATGLIAQPERSRYRLTRFGARLFLSLASLHRTLRLSEAGARAADAKEDEVQ